MRHAWDGVRVCALAVQRLALLVIGDAELIGVGRSTKWLQLFTRLKHMRNVDVCSCAWLPQGRGRTAGSSLHIEHDAIDAVRALV